MSLVRIGALLAIFWTSFQIYSAGAGFMHVMLMRPIHVAFALSVAFLTYPFKKPKTAIGSELDEELEQKGKIYWFDGVLAGLSLFIAIYMLINAERVIRRIPFVDEILLSDKIVGILLIVLVLEAGRRVVGVVLPALAGLFLAYQIWGQNLPGILRHSGVTIEKFIDMQFMSPDGIFSTPIGVSVSTVFYFLLFASFLEISGGGQFFIDMAIRFTGSLRGGPAKTAILASSLMGSISGSAVGNVAGTGVFTIPLMKRSGYSPAFAGAVEAVASTGGQIMPPIMGAAAFVMAQFVGVPYIDVAIAALIPALLFYIALFIAVDIRAKELGLIGISKQEAKELGKNWKGRIHLIVPLIVLIFMIFKGYSLMYAGFIATLVILPVSWVRKESRVKLNMIISALEETGRKAVVVAVPSAVAGIMVGIVTFTGLGMKFSAFLVQVSAGHLGLTLVLVAIACMISGMAMPTTAAYIITAVLMAPALIDIGVAPLAAHLFVFYFAIMSMITPPVALAAYAGAGISGADPMRTGFQAWFLALSGFVIPFAFVNNNALLLQGSVLEIMYVSIMAIVGVYSIAKGTISLRIAFYHRALYILSGIFLVSPNWLTDGVGVGGLLIALWLHREKKVNPEEFSTVG